MNISERVNLLINRSGLKKKFIAQELGVKYETLRKKLKGESDFKIAELYQLSKILKIKMEEFITDGKED